MYKSLTLSSRKHLHVKYATTSMIEIYLRKHMESKLMTTTSKVVNAAEAPDINEVNAAGAVDINEVKIAESAEEKLPEC